MTKLYHYLQSAILVLAVTSFHLSASASEKLTAQEIVEKASIAAYYGGDDGRTMARMVIVDANGRKQLRQFTILRKDLAEAGEQKFLVVFSRPSDVSGTVFMVHKRPGGEDDRWLYLPALDLVKRISSGDKRTSFVGAHYFYEDVSGRSPSEDHHELISETEQFYVLSHMPKDKDSVEFSSYKTWIDKTTFLPMTIEYQDKNNNTYRKIEALEVKSVQSIPTVTRAKVSDLRDGSHTLMEFRKMVYDLGIPDSIFSERALRTPPNEWLKGS